MYGTKLTTLLLSGVTVIELMIALHFLWSSAGMITVKPVTLIFAVEPSCFATAFAMSMSKPVAFPLTSDSAGGYVVSTHQTIGFGMFEALVDVVSFEPPPPPQAARVETSAV